MLKFATTIPRGCRWLRVGPELKGQGVRRVSRVADIVDVESRTAPALRTGTRFWNPSRPRRRTSLPVSALSGKIFLSPIFTKQDMRVFAAVRRKQYAERVLEFLQQVHASFKECGAD